MTYTEDAEKRSTSEVDLAHSILQKVLKTHINQREKFTLSQKEVLFLIENFEYPTYAPPDPGSVQFEEVMKFSVGTGSFITPNREKMRTLAGVNEVKHNRRGW
jgi:hypothetical protein